MSIFFGIFNRNGTPVNTNIANNMFKVMTNWNLDINNLLIDGPVAIGHGMLWNTLESKYEHLPLDKDSYILTMDARIDNRYELAKQLELPNCPMSQIGDSELILAAYKKWGEECPKYLLGDFAFVIWDKKKQQLFCARDYIGIKPFYYYLDNEKFIFSNEIKIFFAYPGIEYTLNKNAIAYYLKYNFLAEQSTTFYENIHKLLPATTLIIKKNEEKIYTYWEAEKCPKIRYENVDEYIYKARELLEKAVYDRMRSIYPIASHLSGGLDSSSIAVLASRKLAENRHTLTGFNWIPILDHNNNDYFEWRNSKKIALLENIKHKAIDLSENDILDIYKTVDITLGDAISFWYENPIQQYASKKGIRVILSGTGGDQFISHKGREKSVEFFSRENYKRINRASHSKISGVLNMIRETIKYVIRPIIPNLAFCFYNRTNCRYKTPKYVQPSIAELMKKLRISNGPIDNTDVQKSMISELTSGSIQSRIDSWSTSGRLNKLEYRYPLLDKRLVEFALGIPEELFSQNGKKRFLFRRMIEDLLPHEITWFETKYEPVRVKNYMTMAKKAHNNWIKTHNITDDKFINIDDLINEIEKLNLDNYDTIANITSAIMLVESLHREKKC